MEKDKKAARLAQLQKSLDIEYKAMMHMFIERKILLEENGTKVFSLILNNYCTKPMMNRVQDHPKYDTKIIDNLYAWWRKSRSWRMTQSERSIQ